MPVPRFSSKQWFWGAVLVAFLWAYLGTAKGARKPNSAQEGMQTVQVWANKPVEIALVPGSFLARTVQGSFVYVGEWMTTSRKATMSQEAMEARLRDMEAELNVVRGRLRDSEERFATLKAVHDKSGLTEADLRSANITGYGPGVGSSLIRLDKGRNVGIEPGMAVISKTYIVGRVESVTPATSMVRLLTDPSPKSRVRAMIVHRSDSTPLLKANTFCLVEGRGNGQLECNSVEKTNITTRIEVGNLVELLDAEWPAPLQHFVIGEVADVGGNDILRYSIRITPRVNVNTLQTVDVVVRK